MTMSSSARSEESNFAWLPVLEARLAMIVSAKILKENVQGIRIIFGGHTLKRMNDSIHISRYRVPSFREIRLRHACAPFQIIVAASGCHLIPFWGWRAVWIRLISTCNSKFKLQSVKFFQHACEHNNDRFSIKEGMLWCIWVPQASLLRPWGKLQLKGLTFKSNHAQVPSSWAGT